MPDHCFSKEIFPNIQPKSSLTQLEAIASRPVASYLGEESWMLLGNIIAVSLACEVTFVFDSKALSMSTYL